MRLIYALAVVMLLAGMAQAGTIYVDSVNGSDSNAGTQYAPVATWERALDLGAAGATTGVVWAEGDTPSRDVAYDIISAKDDREDIAKYSRVVPEHNPVISRQVSRSSTARVQIITDYVWVVVDQEETCIGENITVREY